MLIGVDDSGDFENDDYNLFATVYIRPKKAGQIRKRFESWENSLPTSVKNTNGEVKGYLLDNAMLQTFVERS